jgi:hypothetical protein
LPLQITKQVSSKKCGKIITYGFEWAFHYQFFAAGALMNWICEIFWAAETVFLQFKEQVPFNFENKISAVQLEWKTSRLI